MPTNARILETTWFEFRPLHRAQASVIPALILMAFGHRLCVAQIQSPPQYAFSITTNQTTGNIWPEYLGNDSSGNLYVGGVGRVVKFSENGSYVTQWGTNGTGPGQFAYPGNFAVDQMNEVFVTDPYNDRIQKFTADGSFLMQWGRHGTNNGQFDYPEGLAVDTNGYVYVVDANNNRIQVFNGNGVYIRQWGIFGDGPGQLDGPATIAIDSSNNVYVTDSSSTEFVGNYRVQKFATDGTFVAQWGAYGTNNAGYEELGGIATDRGNNVYVADVANNRVQKYDSNGQFLAQWGVLGTGPGQFNGPFGVTVDPTGNYVLVADYYNDRIEVFAYAPGAPLIYSQPRSQTVAAGVNVTFSASVYGAAPLAYQWLSNGSNVPGASTATLSISNVALSASGSLISVLVTNSAGAAPSSNAVLTVLPVVVTTLPATGISATGAIVNGSVALGPNQTLAWFEWGTDTNYGSITGVTNIAASNVTIPLAAPLAGLSSDYLYHFRLVAWNSLGLVYGDDLTFAVGLAPTVVTLSASGATRTNAILNASINPEGLDTVAWFRWGTSVYYGYTTTRVPMGRGPNSIVTNSTIFFPTQEASQGTIFHCQVMASNKLGIVTGADVSFIAGPWVLAGIEPTTSWTSLGMSADGARLFAITADRAAFSPDAGTTWQTNSVVAGQWQALAVSADGTRLAAASGTSYSPLYLSTNSGANWYHSPPPYHYWAGIASSADGLQLAAVEALGRGIYTSTNGGQTLTSNNAPALYVWAAIASSADGMKLVAAAGGSLPTYGTGPIYSSADGGLTWVSNNVPRNYWRSLASSADGNKLAVAAGWFTPSYIGPIYVSTNSGLSWNPSPAPITNWQAIATSADGATLASIPRSGNAVYISTNFGISWVTNALPSGTWVGIASSADGAELAVASTEFIFILRNTPAPLLNTSRIAGNTLLHWLVPSANFTLQQSPGLSNPNWSDINLTPTFIFSNLHNQVILPPTNASGFFRLRKP